LPVCGPLLARQRRTMEGARSSQANFNIVIVPLRFVARRKVFC
jgi:hypothetical protein